VPDAKAKRFMFKNIDPTSSQNHSEPHQPVVFYRVMRPFSALKRFLLPDGRKPLRIVSGPFKGIAMNLSLQHQVQIYLGLFEKETHPWLSRLSVGIETAIDVGAAYGEYTLFFLKKTNAARIVAFEPDPKCLLILRENLKLNGAEQSSRLELSETLVGDSDHAGMITLDSLAKSIRSPCFIKMDVDGSEATILHGATTLNALPGIRWLIETHSKTLETECVQLLTAVGFKTRIIPNAWWRALVPELRPIEHNRWLAAWKTLP